MLAYLAVFAAAAGATWILTFPVRALAKGIGAVVPPDPGRIHTRIVPTLGGAAMYLAFFVAMFVASHTKQFAPVFHGSSEPLGVMLAATVIFAVGALDDLVEVSPPAKFAGQVLAGSVLYFLGVSMFYFRIPFGDLFVLSRDLAPLATVLWVAAVANAVNFIDGLDGLAAGVIGIGALAFTVYSARLTEAGLLTSDNIGPLIAVIVAGVCVGFLPHNFNPAKIIMGDAGALFLGLLMASSTLVVGGRINDAFSGQTYFFYAPLFIPFFILGVPILDTISASARRALRRRSPAGRDTESHLHYRLMRLGHGHRRSVVILWGWTAILSGFVLYPTFANRGNQFIPFGVAALGLALYTLFHP
ncbi:MAG: undecaprenyl/decaprenyl-phosphate alpha-N-acetylglucosaminyl 1-phosphate transferase, partial [Actinobacteria bacterium]|nr:undecaprenyl/decaprenyl-phosphate alpha-N-acetylglucosaminyl 1-phosphate transferase [Actinomycetota bacterium]